MVLSSVFDYSVPIQERTQKVSETGPIDIPPALL